MKARSSHLKTLTCLFAGTVVSLGALTVSPEAQEPARAVLAAQVQNECDRMAGSPFDQDRNPSYTAVSVSDIDAQAVTACRSAFEATGNPRYAFQLGRALNKAEQADEAMTAYEAAVKANYAAAKVNLGMLLGRIGDIQAEFNLYSEAANSGNVLAAYNLGVSYRDGLGTTADARQAIAWFEKAAAAGDDTAAFNIGVIYDEGSGVTEDNQLAIAWYDLAAKRGNKDAMINLGLMYEAGEGIRQNPEAAANLYAEAAAAGDGFAAQKLKEMQDAGVAVHAPAPEVSSLPSGIDMLVLAPNDVETPSTLKAI